MKLLLLALSALSLSACTGMREDLKSPCAPGAKTASLTTNCDLTPINIASLSLSKRGVTS